MIKRGNSLIMKPNKISIRPSILGINDSHNLSFEERFQNKTLRPIIKLQHEILVAIFHEYLIVKKCNFELLSNSKKLDFIFKVFNRDNTFKSDLKGIIIGHFTTEEFSDYCCNKSEFNKRILTMIKERLISVIV
jgi:hypothetical protein